MTMRQVQKPGAAMRQAVRAAFVSKGSSLFAWCKANGVDWAYASRALTGEHDFAAAKDLRKRICAAAFDAADDESSTKQRKTRA